ncbi:pyridoxamine 5'-phosphate oxidase family protein [Nonomuraea sp. NPDC050790]|uniref:pyridoxamine 5'-phosphate oxidase family protein n=1 Tax=Nonomuraea sp. NPDC050790 TaxID=3364371 RepID=UPI0037B23207
MSSVILPAPRDLVRRRADTLDRLNGGFQMWLATGSDGHGAHLIPVAYVWDGAALTTGTFRRSRTVSNLRGRPKARLAIGDTADVVMIDAGAALVGVSEIDAASAEAFARVSTDPRSAPDMFVYVRLVPERILAWNSLAEFSGRTLMLKGSWLDAPVD